MIAYVDADGYPMSVATDFEVDEARGTVSLRAVAGDAQPPQGERVNVVFSHIRPQPGIGYDERRYVSLWGPLRRYGGRARVLAGGRPAPTRSTSLEYFERASAGQGDIPSESRRRPAARCG